MVVGLLAQEDLAIDRLGANKLLLSHDSASESDFKFLFILICIILSL